MKRILFSLTACLILMSVVTLYSCQKLDTATAPTIAAIIPDSASVGNVVLITGNNLNNATSVTFNGVAATISATTSNSVTVRVPVGATTGLVTVTTPSGSATSPSSFVVIAVVTNAPTIISFTPGTATPVNDTIKIKGTNLSTASTIAFGTTAGTILSKNDTSLLAITPNVSLTGPISIITASGVAISPTNITIFAIPVVTSFTPTAGAAGTVITITGNNFIGATSVSIGDSSIAFSVVNATTITATLGNDTTGFIKVTNPYGKGTSLTTFLFSRSSNEIAAGKLIAHWTFDGTTAEALSNVSAQTTSGTVNYIPGRIGQALSFNNAYLIYPTIANLNQANALAGGYTLSMWVQLSSPEIILTPLFQINGNISDFQGLVGLMYRKNSDTLDFDGLMTNVDATGTHSTYFDNMLQGTESGFSFSNTSWALLTMVYDSTAKTISYYGNGVLRGSKSIASTIIPAGEQFQLVTTETLPGTTISEVSFGTFDVKPAFPNADVSLLDWMNGGLTGSLDDVRLFNTSLSQTDITALYTRGLAGN